jgi:allantoinase
MLEHHGRYDYVNIDDRPVYDWPNGTRLAVYVAMNDEVFRYGKGKGAGIAPPEQATSDSVYSWRDYGNRVGFWRLMDMFDELGIPCEHQINTALYDHHPDIMARIRDRGDEILGHGITNSDEQHHLPEAEEKAFIEETLATIERHEGTRPTGWMSPWLSNSKVTLDLLQEAGIRYTMDWTSDDQPIWAATRNGKILLMPYPVEVNDNRGLVWFRYSSSEFTDMIIDQFDEMLEQSAKQPLVCPISLHPFVVGRPYRIRQLRRAFRHILSYKDQIWLTTPGAICRHVESVPKGMVPGDGG